MGERDMEDTKELHKQEDQTIKWILMETWTCTERLFTRYHHQSHFIANRSRISSDDALLSLSLFAARSQIQIQIQFPSISIPLRLWLLFGFTNSSSSNVFYSVFWYFACNSLCAP